MYTHRSSSPMNVNDSPLQYVAATHHGFERPHVVLMKPVQVTRCSMTRIRPPNAGEIELKNDLDSSSVNAVVTSLYVSA